MAVIRALRLYWRQILIVIWPIILTPLIFPFDKTSTESKCSFIVLLVAVFWVVELLPIPITALLPIALRPLLGISPAKDGAKVFFSDLTMLIIGGVTVSLALETSMLHKRMAYTLLDKIGVQPRRLMLGIMLMSAFLSMWISNTAASAMMIPITRALLQKLYAEDTGCDRETETEIRKERKHLNLKDGGSVGNDDENCITVESPEEENVENQHGDRYVDDDAKVESVSEALLTPNTPEHKHERYQQTKQKLDDLLSRQQGMKNRNSRTFPASNGNETNTCILTPESLETDEKDSNSVEALFFRKTWCVFSLCIAYSANIGGLGTLIGSPPNLILSQTVNEMSGRVVISFAQWSMFGFPVSVVTLALTYAWMNILLFGVRSTLTCRELRSKREVALAAKQVRQELEEMGLVSYSEKIVLVHFVVLVILLLTRRPGFVTGWSALLQDENFISDGSVAIAVAVSLFIFSNERPAVFCFRSRGDDRPPQSLPPLLSWKEVSKNFPWGTILLIGGGTVLVDTIKVSGLSASIAPYMMHLQVWPAWLTCLLVITLTCLATELCSNTVITILILPILKDLAAVLDIHPLYLMFPATVATSMAFMLPVATPPNTLVYSFGGVKVSDMVGAGFVLNVIGILVILLGVHSWGWYTFQLDTVPDWARLSFTDTNSTVDPLAVSLTVTDLPALLNQSFPNNSSRLFV